jgi:L-2-hydroxyglutarate oxidase
MGDFSDYLIIGGGIIGLHIARELKTRFKRRSVRLLEKESSVGRHASGRNSGVLHAGFYYSADSMKARFCRDGNRQMRAYCQEHGLPLRTCGKLVVARNAKELAGLDELHRRGTANEVHVEMLSLAEAQRIEPRVLSHERVLWSPDTASADPLAVIASIERDCMSLGVDIRKNVSYHSGGPGVVSTAQGTLTCNYLINAAGLYADRIAKDFGFCTDYTILPFKGIYLYGQETSAPLRTHIYPVPDLAYPFLGVHITLTVDGHTKIGPTAIPAFWREQYAGLDGLNLMELGEILWREASLMLHAGFDFRGLAVQELRKYSPSYLVAQATQLLDGVKQEDFTSWGRPGIRAQLLNMRTRTLVMDFCLEGDARSLHVLNAVSPAWTCSMPFSAHVVDEALRYGAPGN